MTVLEFTLHMAEKFDGFWSKERDGKASKSEIRRWIKNGSVQINGSRPRDIEEKIEGSVTSFVLFPKNEKSRITLM